MPIMENPYPSRPGERDERLSQVRSKIRSSSQIPDELKDEIAERAAEFVTAEIRKAVKGTHSYGGQLGWTRWVIRNDHLDLVAALAPIASGIATYATAVSGANPIVLAITLIFAVAAIGRKLKAKSASLDSDDYGVLMALK